MIICKVIDHVWATKKDPKLDGQKLMVVQKLDAVSLAEGDTFVAADAVGAGMGERVLVVTGSMSRQAFAQPDIPVDAVIVGIIDP